jgi:DNA-binding FadR family transcriptional regulator
MRFASDRDGYESLLDAPSISSRTLSGDLAERLGRDILGGRIRERSILPREEDLASRYHVSRTVVRDAIRMLTAKGLVEARTKRGTIVHPRGSWRLLDHDVLRWIAAGGDAAITRDLIELRQVIEPAAAQLAAARATPDDVERISAACAMMASHVSDERTFLEADVAFHMAVLGASHNESLFQLSQAIKVALFTAFERSMKIPDAALHALPLHEAVFEAIRARNPLDAGAAMMLCVRQDGAAPQSSAGSQ